MSKDGLIYGLGRAKVPGSYKTRYNHLAEARRFVAELRQLGHGVQKWENISNKHVGAVVDAWKARGLSTATIKEYLSGVRAVAAAWGNSRIAEGNTVFGLERRVYVDNRDKAVPYLIYDDAVKRLATGNDLQRRVGLQLELQRTFGLRKEESFKLHPARAHLDSGSLFISDGTKGGRERIIHDLRPWQVEVLERAKEAAAGGSLIPEGWSERHWERYFYRQTAAAGISRTACGASSHGLRHAYAQWRYREMTCFRPPCLHDTRADFIREAVSIVGTDWMKIDADARLILKAELGHGPDRDDVVSVYLGSWRG